MKSPRILLFILSPALILALLYVIFLGGRSDYAGHFMAGFGGTLFAIMSCVEIQRDKPDPPPIFRTVLIVFFACVAFGTLLEATTFRLAKFDEIDYCNQSLGAVVAALSSLIVLPGSAGRSSAVLPSMIVGILFLIAGFFYAFN